MGKHEVWAIALGLAIGGLVFLWQAQPVAMQGAATVSGFVFVRDSGGVPVSGAIVRRKATTNFTTSAANGSFTLGGLPSTVVTITAWHEGYLIGWATVTPPKTGVVINLTPHYTVDDPTYQWHSAWGPENDPLACQHCMVAFPEWEANAHRSSAINPRFFSMYNGTSITASGTVTPGYKLDFPGMKGNCAACHAPVAAVEGITTPITPAATITDTFLADMNTLSGIETEGVFCEFCHKIGDVYLDPGTGLPYDNAPGVLSMRLYRSPPPVGQWVLFFGSFDDVTRKVTFLPLEKKSEYCAPCHQFSFWGTPIFESYREWLESSYPAQGKECQACHMTPTGVNHFVVEQKDSEGKPIPGLLIPGGLFRDPNLIASHLESSANNEALLQDTVAMSVSAQTVLTSHLQITVTLTNTGAGHHVPTDHPGRHLILTVTAKDGYGHALTPLSGPAVPNWGGAQAGLPGKIFAKVLRDVETGESPVVSYWKQTAIDSDNRLPAMGSDTSTYTFPVPDCGGPVHFTVKLRFRRLLQALMNTKGWSTPDIVMEEASVTLYTEPAWEMLWLPAVSKTYRP